MPRIVKFRDSSGFERVGEWTDSGIKSAGERLDSEEVDILPPTEPTKVICLYGNYLEHLRESGFEIPEEIPKRPKLFLKGPNAVIGHRDVIRLPEPGVDSGEVGELGKIETGVGRVDYESELGVVIGEQARNVKEGEAMNFVKGFTCVNDVSNRDDQSAERNWVRGKSFDGAAPIGPVVATPDLVPEEPRVRLRLNGEIKQDSIDDEFIFSVREVIAEITKFMTLEPGDVIAMGTPSGVGPLEDGDKVEVIVEGVGTLVNFVKK